ncbi:flagellar hook protein FlgE [Oryzibacter oryziterrae]|uniref:flagellar hook protein FlgE n=1 Tax=Oryzibacter oryziterrae TaxID=2766474 RepID=UPI001F36BB8F|nr:flagellar hook-basal body complex protein [Oryzibacter oryziterrae]
MGILSAMNNSVGGIAAQSFALENISGNIANSQTTAYKRTDTSFSDLVQSSTSNVQRMTAGNVMASSRSTIGLDGDTQTDDVDTHMAIRGTGFFQVNTGDVGSEPNLYTRRGDFALDADGYLVNGSGYSLLGYSLPVADGSVNALQRIRINKDSINAEATKNVVYALNLPTTPQTAFSTSTLGKGSTVSDIWQAGGSSGITGDTRTGPVAAVTNTELDEFIANSVSGGSITSYDSQGTAVNLSLRWAKTGTNEWALYYQSAPSTSTTDPIWTQIPSGTSASSTFPDSFHFNPNGTMVEDASALAVTGVTVNGVSLGTIDMAITATQFADSNGKITQKTFTQDGSPVGYFDSMSINDAGKIVYAYTNGKTEEKWDIPLVTFRGQSALKPMDGGAYSETMESGSPSVFDDGKIVGSALESSNVDISEEFTKLIVTQQAFSANSKVITTADQMMSDILNIIR